MDVGVTSRRWRVATIGNRALKMFATHGPLSAANETIKERSAPPQYRCRCFHRHPLLYVGSILLKWLIENPSGTGLKGPFGERWLD